MQCKEKVMRVIAVESHDSLRSRHVSLLDLVIRVTQRGISKEGVWEAEAEITFVRGGMEPSRRRDGSCCCSNMYNLGLFEKNWLFLLENPTSGVREPLPRIL